METSPQLKMIRCRDARDLFDYLRLNQVIWRDAGYGDMAFRGQRSASWGLLPSAFRSECVLGYRDNVRRGPSNDALTQCLAEFNAVKEFVHLADAVGLPVPGDSQLFRDPSVTSQVVDSWPPPTILETLAVARHHGVPTRLLDFTLEPMTAALIAAEDQLENGKPASDDDGSTALAVWAVDLRFVRWARESGDSIREVTVPRANNPFLHAQHGLFLVDTKASEAIQAGDVPSLERVLCERAAYWQSKKGFFGGGGLAKKLLPPVIKLGGLYT